MELVQNFPFFAIMLYLAGGVTCCVLKPKASETVCLLLNILVTCLMAAVLLYTISFVSGTSYNFMMGHFPAPWGNEIRIGPLEALMAVVLPGVMTLILFGNMKHIYEDIEPEKVSLYFTVCNLLMVSLLALVFTNDIFTGYVFVEINTIASCALVMVRYRSGKALAATTRYLIMSLLGSGMFLIGIVILYDLTGHLLMEPAGKAVAALLQSGEYTFPLTIVTGLFAVGMGLKSALWPFHEWLPDAHGSATSASSGILSGLVLKGYIILFIKLSQRVLGAEISADSSVLTVLFFFGIAGMLFGSLSALHEKDVKRMLAYSSVAQIGYIYAGIGLGTRDGLIAAFIQIIVHAFTKPMLFTAAGGLMDVSGGSRKLTDLRGSGRRNPLAGIAFSVGALSMIGIPLFGGFITKITLTQAVITASPMKTAVGITVIILSTVLNALYYLPYISVIFTRNEDGHFGENKCAPSVGFLLSLLLFIILNFFIGTHSGIFTRIISSGLNLFA